MTYRTGAAFAVLILFLVLAGCGGGELLPAGEPAEQLAVAGDYLRRGKELRALEAYRLIARKYPGSEWEEKARLGIARSYRKQGDYFAAVQEYESFQRRFSRSPLVSDAMLEIGLCYVDQQAKPEYDQEWNDKAIRQLEDFLAAFPESPRAQEARTALFGARRHIARKELENGITYVKLRRLKAARFYFDLVRENWPDTPEAAEALFETGRTFEAEKKTDEALSSYRKLIAGYSDSRFVEEAARRIDRLEREEGKGK